MSLYYIHSKKSRFVNMESEIFSNKLKSKCLHAGNRLRSRLRGLLSADSLQGVVTRQLGPQFNSQISSLFAAGWLSSIYHLSSLRRQPRYLCQRISVSSKPSYLGQVKTVKVDATHLHSFYFPVLFPFNGTDQGLGQGDIRRRILSGNQFPVLTTWLW